MTSLFARKQTDREPPALFPTYLLPALSFRRKSRQSSTESTASTSSNLTTTSTLSTDSNGPSTPSSNPFSRSATPVPAPLSNAPIEAPTDKFLSGHVSHIHCAKCATDLCLTSQIISKGFTGRHGRAYLIQGLPPSSSLYKNTVSKTFYTKSRGHDGRELSLPNTFLGKPVPRGLVTGQHMVADLNCGICGTLLGWKYVEASEENQKYKVGKFILETKRIRVGVRWDNEVGAPFEDTDSRYLVGENDDDRYEVAGGSRRSVEALKLLSSDGQPQAQRVRQGVGEDGRELEFDSQDEDECEDLFAGVWSPGLAARRRQRKSERFRRKAAKVYVPRAGGSQESLGY
ncbi:hypothetical protein H2198_007614 [Neophaeococcomyces mojaviensis]|uniref:Uncharacterized protein n=1 Tax=Neophaeococcomyces mojaviensis TaxID=3383035 RepID=A0ACC2ZZD7_9EURO|nr:hypothetical protein H2198_007614 [Knufia sp. JES_112]